MMTIKYSELSRIISHALRHEPWLYELELDEEGWVFIKILLDALRKLESCKQIQESDLICMIQQSDKNRHEIKDGKIRALYGHSISGKLLKTQSIPPEILEMTGSSRNN